MGTLTYLNSWTILIRNLALGGHIMDKIYSIRALLVDDDQKWKKLREFFSGLDIFCDLDFRASLFLFNNYVLRNKPSTVFY